jgi:poly-gamma-glutamate capsule biosynthesis protein CapA/YwtB (metallophosphatase superfamily)
MLKLSHSDLPRRAILTLAGALAGGRSARPGGSVTALSQTGDDQEPAPARDTLTLFLGGDVMTGRGIDQLLPHPSDPRLFESHATSALDYVRLAERANGPIPRPVGPAYIWGEALEELDRIRPDARIVNLETSVTTSDQPWPKGINYRMHPANIGCLTAAGIDCCVLANNHVLDWGRAGLQETLATLAAAGVRAAGAGVTRETAKAPAVIEVQGKARVLVFGFGTRSSGIPLAWAAREEQPGVNLLEDLSERTVARIANQVWALKQPGDIVVASVHWGGNWGYEVPTEQRAFAHGLVEVAGVDVVHGHSSHHAKAVEVYDGRLILYGCGDLLNDYEGIGAYEAFRDDLALMYFVALAPATGHLVRLATTVLQIRRFRLQRASRADTLWIGNVLTREGARFGTRAEPTGSSALMLGWS